MPFQYDPPPSGALRQGEILGDIWEHVPRHPPVESQPDQTFAVDSVLYKFVVVMSPDCDLDWDFKARFPDQPSKDQLTQHNDVSSQAASLSHVFLARCYLEANIRPLVPGSDLWKRIKQNQDERYHHLQSASLIDLPQTTLPDLYIDFKKSLAIPTHSLYEGIRVQGVKRVVLIPNIYIHDLMHRYYGFLSRVGLPDS